MPAPWLVLWHHNGARLGSFPLCMLSEAQALFNMSRIQTDVNGTEHWEVFSTKRKRRVK